MARIFFKKMSKTPHLRHSCLGVGFVVASLLLSCSADIETSTEVNLDCDNRKDLEICNVLPSEDTESSFRIVTNEDEVEINWETIAESLSYNVKLSTKPDCSGDPLQSYTGKETSAMIMLEQDGIYFVCVASIFPGAKNLPEANYVFKVIRDTKAPSISLAKRKKPLLNEAFSPDIATEDLTKLSYVWKKLSGPGSLLISDKQAKSPSISASADGDYELGVEITDELGYRTNYSLIFSWDTTKPSVSMNSEQTSPTNAQTINLSIEFTEDVYGFELNDVTIVNGTPGNFKGVSERLYTLDITPLGNGEIKVTLGAGKVKDAAGNSNHTSEQFNIVWDNRLPAFTSLALANDAVDGYVNALEHVLSNPLADTLIASDYDLVEYSLIEDSVNCSESEGNFSTTIPSSDSPSFVAQTNYRICVKLTNAQGSVFGESDIISFDSNGPSVALTSSVSNPTNAVFSVTATFSEAVSGFDATDITVSNGSVSNVSGSDAMYTFDVTPLTDGLVTIDIHESVVLDLAGNSNSAASQFSLNYDGSAPTVTLLSAASNPTNSVFSVTATFSEAVTGFDAADITLSNGSVSNVSGSEAVYTFNVTPLADGLVTVEIAASVANDTAGNFNTASDQFTLTYDTTAPVAVLASTPIDPTSSFSYNIDVTSDDGLISYQYAIINSPSICSGATYNGSWLNESTNISGNLTGEGTFRLCVKGKDAAGNEQQAATEYVWTYDATGPTVELSSTVSSPSNANPIPVRVSFSEPITGFDEGDISLVNASVSASSLVDNEDGTFDFTITPQADGDITVDIAEAVATDVAGNSNTAASQLTITYDSTPPVFNSLSLANDAADGFINAVDHTNASDLAGGLDASGYDSAFYLLIKDSAECGLPAGSFGAMPQADSSNFDAEEGYRVCVMLSDAAGNTSFGESDVIVFDQTGPSDIMISIDDGDFTRNSTINLSFAATGANYMYVTNTQGCAADGANESYAASKSNWTHGASNATAIVYVKFIDDAGNESECISDSIIHDDIAPSVDVGSDFNQTTATISIDATTSDSSGIASYSWAKASGAGPINFSAQTSEDTNATASADDTYVLTLTVTDNAGNIATDSLQFTYDTTAPTAPASIATTSGADYIDLSWADGGGDTAGYLLVRSPAGAAMTFSPTDGTSYSAGAQGADYVVYAGTAVEQIDAGASYGGSHNYDLYAFDSLYNYSSATSTSASLTSPCAAGWVLVPGDKDYGTEDFCVMKYEAKDNGSGSAVSQAANSPWVSISQQDSLTECTALGAGYDLISNDEWMSVASNVAAQDSNWSGGSVGSGVLNRGHSDGSPGSACAASSNDLEAFVETDCTPKLSGAGEDDEATQKRTHTLSNGAVVWDLSGNVWNWTSYVISDNTDKPYASADGSPQFAWREFTAVDSGFTSMAQTQLRPTNALKSFWDDSWNSGQSVGQYIAGQSGSGGALPRGAYWNNFSKVGVFAAYLNDSPSSPLPNIGFRCVQRLEDQDPAALALSPADGQIAASWSGGTNYLLVRGPAGSHTTFVPVDGTSYSIGAQGSDTIVYDGTGTSTTDSSLENGKEYHYALYTYDGSANYSTAPVRAKDIPMTCPTGFVLVPGDADYGTNDFCIMKYEAKNVGDVAASKPEQTPWVSISQETAKGECTALGAGYHLITNDEWMTAATNMAAVASNWNGGIVGTNNLYRGHSDNNPAMACAASSDDSKAYVENTCTPLASGGGEDSETTERRTMSLSNGAVVWDMGGNVYNWASYINIDDKPYQTATDGAPVAAWREYTLIDNGFGTTAQTDLIPTAAILGSWTSTKGIGRYYAGVNASGGALVRGSVRIGSLNSGVFGANLAASPTYEGTDVGFRCALSRPSTMEPKNITATTLSTGVSMSWQSPSASTTGYLVVRGANNNIPEWRPTNGTSYSTGPQEDDEVVLASAATSLNDSSTMGNQHYHVYGHDASNNYSNPVVISADRCPAGWVLVPGDPDYGTTDFCMMKYEAKNVSNTPASLPDDTPWVSISQEDAVTECASLGAGYKLISNDEWMSAASNIANVASNWSGSSVGSGAMNRGHSDNNPSGVPCQASINDLEAFVESDCTPKLSGAGEDDEVSQKRTHTLSNGDVVWDLSGNVWDWTSYVISDNTDKPTPMTAAWQEYTTPIVGSNSMTLTQLRPTNALKSFWDDSWNSTESVGKYYAGVSGSDGALPRGGRWSDGSVAGVFTATLSYSPSFELSYLGFRCARELP